MATVEFVLKSMCVLPYVRITVREIAGRRHNVLGSGMYDKIIRRYGARQVVSSSVSDDVLFIDISPTVDSCEAFSCRHEAVCIVQPCLGENCPLCDGMGLCRVCFSKKACKK